MTKKLFRVFMTLALILPMTFVLASCSDDDDEQAGAADITTGAWWWEDEQGNRYCDMAFEDGEVWAEIYGYGNASCTVDGEYTQSGHDVTVKIDYCSNTQDFPELRPGSTHKFYVDGNYMTITFNGEKLTFERYIDDDDDDE